MRKPHFRPETRYWTVNGEARFSASQRLDPPQPLTAFLFNYLSVAIP